MQGPGEALGGQGGGIPGWGRLDSRQDCGQARRQQELFVLDPRPNPHFGGTDLSCSVGAAAALRGKVSPCFAW